MSLVMCVLLYFFFFFFNDTATTEIYTLSLHDALPISFDAAIPRNGEANARGQGRRIGGLSSPETSSSTARRVRSEEHTSELQSRLHLVCRLLLEKKNKNDRTTKIRMSTTIAHSTTLYA